MPSAAQSFSGGTMVAEAGIRSPRCQRQTVRRHAPHAVALEPRRTRLFSLAQGAV